LNLEKGGGMGRNKERDSARRREGKNKKPMKVTVGGQYHPHSQAGKRLIFPAQN